MSQPIEMALLQVNSTIPFEILQAVFEPFKRGISLDHCIYTDVIQNRVLKECNLYAGRMTTIPLTAYFVEETNVSQLQAFPYEMLYVIYRIPPQIREYKSIVSVISVEFPSQFYNISTTGMPPGMGGSGCSTTNLSTLACQALQSAASPMGITGVPKPLPTLLAGDLVRLSPSASVPLPGFEWMLTCRLEYDAELTNLNASAVKPFSYLVEHAVKAYIYNHSVLKIDKFYIEGGMEIGRIREIIDSYSDQEEKYKEEFLKFRGASTVLSPEFKRIWAYRAL